MSQFAYWRERDGREEYRLKHDHEVLVHLVIRYDSFTVGGFKRSGCPRGGVGHFGLVAS